MIATRRLYNQGGDHSRETRRASARRRHLARRSGFTLVELLVVVLIILIVSAAALPVVIPAVSHRQVSEAARILQGALVGAHDTAIHNGAPAGIRLLPDPSFNGINQNPQSQLFGLLDPSLPLAANRIIPIEPAPDYSEGMVSIIQDPPGSTPFNNYTTAYLLPPYPAIQNTTANGQSVTNGVLMVEECPGAWQLVAGNWVFNPNEPTSWFWNIRIGEKIQIGNAGQIYTIVGPLFFNQNNSNPDLFVNDGPPGSTPQLTRTYTNPTGGSVTVQVEYLFLVNGQDDPPQDGFVDNLWNTASNNGNALTDQMIEFENETWQGSLASLPPLAGIQAGYHVNGYLNLAYTINRRPVPSARGRETQLPSDVVIDLTTLGGTQERSRIPLQAQNPSTGSVDILVYPSGQVVPTMNFSTPASVGLTASFFHFWLAERSDVAAINVDPATGNYIPIVAGQNVYLPIGNILQIPGQAPTPYNGPKLKGEYRLVTIFTRNGQVATNENVLFDNPLAPQNGQSYNVSLPFLQAQEGISGGH
ncbi:MAG: prepilin-type N-terminal cleavage/methylation domain-containing protein [Isosphaeraceae bacterium]